MLISSAMYLALHIPDGFLSGPVCGITWAIAAGMLWLIIQKVQNDYQERLVPLMGVCAAFIFAAQMINFPVPGGTSGHLLGGTLAAILLGPWAGSLVMAVVITVQALFFQDGGIMVLGANILNMGLATTLISFYGVRLIRLWLGRNRWQVMAIAAGSLAWISVMVAATLTALQLSVSQTIPLTVALPVLLIWHSLIGLGEAVITVLVVQSLWRTRPDLLFEPPRLSRPIFLP
jgi:cobalt/nickel transport system permease protein